jgi:hypothetical protein
MLEQKAAIGDNSGYSACVDFALQVPASNVIDRSCAETSMRVYEFVIHIIESTTQVTRSCTKGTPIT